MIPAFLIIGAALTAGYFWIFSGGNVVDTTAGPIVSKLALAIATAEGFFVAGSRPKRNNNPGDLTSDLIGRKVGLDGIFPIYANANDGWENLYAQINLWLSGQSKHAGPDSSIADISTFYTADNQDFWAQNVANALGVSVDTSISEIS